MYTRDRNRGKSVCDTTSIKLANGALPETERTTLKFCSGWTTGFKTRKEPKFWRNRGKSTSADVNGFIEAFPVLGTTLNVYSPKLWWNAVEFGVCSHKKLGWTPCSGTTQRIKSKKSRFTGLLCCKAERFEKFPLMFIGSYWRPRPLGKKSVQERGVDYHTKKKAWMTVELFVFMVDAFRWVYRTHVFPKSHFALVSCSAHESSWSLPVPSTVKVHCFLPKTAHCIRTLHAEFIAALKAAYRWRFSFRIIDNVDASAKSICNVDILTAIRWVQEK